MKQDIVLPIIYSSENRVGDDKISMYGVKFLADFGIFKKDTELVTLSINYRLGIMASYSGEIKIQKFIATPI